MVFVPLPCSVREAVVYVAPSPGANPSPPTVTVLLVRGAPSNVLEASPLIRVTLRLLTVRVPSAVEIV